MKHAENLNCQEVSRAHGMHLAVMDSCRNGTDNIYNVKAIVLLIFEGIQVNLTKVLLGCLVKFGKMFKVHFSKLPLSSVEVT